MHTQLSCNEGYLPSLFAVPKLFKFQVASILGTGFFLRASLLLKILASSLSQDHQSSDPVLPERPRTFDSRVCTFAVNLSSPY